MYGRGGDGNGSDNAIPIETPQNVGQGGAGEYHPSGRHKAGGSGVVIIRYKVNPSEYVSKYKLEVNQNDSSPYNTSSKIGNWYSALAIDNQGGSGVGMTFKNTTETGYISYGNNLSDIGGGSFGIATKTTNSTTDLKLVIQKEGNVGIGTINPVSYTHLTLPTN